MQFWIAEYGNPTWLSEQRNFFVFLLIKFKKKVPEGGVGWVERNYKGEAEVHSSRQNISGQVTVQTSISFTVMASHPGKTSKFSYPVSREKWVLYW